MLAFLKVFLIWGIWPTAEKEPPVPVVYAATGYGQQYGQENVYYRYDCLTEAIDLQLNGFQCNY